VITFTDIIGVKNKLRLINSKIGFQENSNFFFNKTCWVAAEAGYFSHIA
jgi:hypothetical protein